ncbi:MAG: hypothetical protein Kow0029_10000 [Candidatus Rifleibacteriota bacterium]
MKKNRFFLILTIFGLFSLAAYAQHKSDNFPLLSQGILEPPPPPPGYTNNVPMTVPAPDNMPNPPMLPKVGNSEHAGSQILPPPNVPEVKVVQAISKPLYENLKRLMRSLYTFRTIVNKPESGEQLRRIQNLGRICSELLGLQRFPPPSRFVPSAGDKVIRDRSYGAVEYRFFGDFDQRLNGWVKPIDTAIYADLVFDGRGRRRNHIRAQFSRNGTLEGYFYAYGWDKYGHNWKLQGTASNLLCHDNGLPYSGELKLYGADPTGKTVALELKFPVKVMGIMEPVKKEIRHHEGRPVHIGN